jgi:UDP-3-O-[3-hydroxymyristoyl] glucosamine N-acyltransferase
MSLKLTLQSILDFLEKIGVDYQLFNPNYKIKVRPAGLYNVINNGLYHFSSEFKGNIPSVQESIFISSRSLNSDNVEILVENPQLLFYQLTNLFEEIEPNRIHETAIIHPEAEIGDNVNIGPYSCVGKCQIGNNVNIQKHVVIESNVVIGDNSFVDSNSCLGQSGIVWVWNDKGERVSQSQLGGVIIEENCHLGTDVTVVRGSLSENTTIGSNSVIAHGTKIGHSAQVGKMVHMANNVSLAGNTTIGERTYLGSGSVIPSNIKVPANTVVGASALVNKNFNEEYCTLVGVPAKVLYKKNYNRKGRGTPLPYK